jgi:hypothetical protein
VDYAGAIRIVVVGVMGAHIPVLMAAVRGATDQDRERLGLTLATVAAVRGVIQGKAAMGDMDIRIQALPPDSLVQVEVGVGDP